MYFKMTAGSYKTSIGLRQEERQRKLFVLSDLLFTELSASVSQYPRLHFATPPYFFFFWSILCSSFQPPYFTSATWITKEPPWRNER